MIKQISFVLLFLTALVYCNLDTKIIYAGAPITQFKTVSVLGSTTSVVNINKSRKFIYLKNIDSQNRDIWVSSSPISSTSYLTVGAWCLEGGNTVGRELYDNYYVSIDSWYACSSATVSGTLYLNVLERY